MIIVSLAMIVVGLTKNGITFNFPEDARWIYVICMSTILLGSSRFLIYKLHDKIMKGRDLKILNDDLYKRYQNINAMITFIPIVILFLALYSVFFL